MPEEPRYNQKLIAAKMKQLERFRKDKAARDGSRAAGRLPPGQTWTPGFPVLDLGVHPPFDPAAWTFRVFGEVEKELTFTWEEFGRLPRAEQVSDFHCVTTWSRKDLRWGGVRAADLLALAKPTAAAAFVIQHSADGYATNTSLFEASHDDALLADSLDGAPLPLEHGGPLRMVIPTLYAWKSAKFLVGLEFTAEDRPGYWETRGYHNEADPWKEERLKES